MGRDAVEGLSAMAPVEVIVFAVVFNTIRSAVIVIAPEPVAMVLPAPAVRVKVPVSPEPAVNVIAVFVAALVRAPATVMSPLTPGERKVTGSVKVTAFIVTSPVPLA